MHLHWELFLDSEEADTKLMNNMGSNLGEWTNSSRICCTKGNVIVFLCIAYWCEDGQFIVYWGKPDHLCIVYSRVNLTILLFTWVNLTTYVLCTPGFTGPSYCLLR